MKLFSCFITLCITAITLGQDFNLEYKSFLLRPHFKARQIQRLTIKKSEDSLFNSLSIQYKLEFDTEGRLIKILDYYFDTDTVPERMIAYTYADSSNYYTGKTYYYLGDMQQVLLEKKWRMYFDHKNNTIEEQFYNQTEVYRTNNLVFNKALQMLSRKVQAFNIQLETYFRYTKEGLIKQVRMIKRNPTSQKMKRLELNQYLQYNLYQKLMTTEQWVGEREKQINEYYFNYIGQDISTKVGWRLMNWNNDDKKLIERTNFTYDQYGLLIGSDYFTERQVSDVHKYKKFEYQFYGEQTDIKIKSDLFITIWFTDLFAEDLIHP